VVAGRALSDADDAEIAIMMVEAGGSERSFQFYDEGAPQVTEEVLADGLEAAKTWIRESIVLQRQMVEAYVASRGPIEAIEYSTLSDYGEDVWERVEAVGTGPLAEANKIVLKAERNAALDAATTAIKESSPGR
jgi:polyribonucleotide nucleotidyltransferase